MLGKRINSDRKRLASVSPSRDRRLGSSRLFIRSRASVEPKPGLAGPHKTEQRFRPAWYFSRPSLCSHAHTHTLSQPWPVCPCFKGCLPIWPSMQLDCSLVAWGTPLASLCQAMMPGTSRFEEYFRCSRSAWSTQSAWSGYHPNHVSRDKPLLFDPWPAMPWSPRRLPQISRSSDLGRVPLPAGAAVVVGMADKANLIVPT